jgi:hypothetical protein
MNRVRKYIFSFSAYLKNKAKHRKTERELPERGEALFFLHGENAEVTVSNVIWRSFSMAVG